MTVLEIPQNATTIAPYSFYNYSKLARIALPNNVDGATMALETVGTNAFAFCSALTSVELPKSVRTIGAGAFADCGALVTMILPFIGATYNMTTADETSLFGHIFGTESTSITPVEQNYSDTTVKSYAIPSTLRTIKVLGGNLLYGAFSNCRMLTSVELDESVSRGVDMGACIFKGCSSINSITIPFVGKSATSTTPSADMLFGYIFGSTVFDGTTPIDQSFAPATDTESNMVTYQIPTSLKSVTVLGGNILYGAFYNMLTLTDLVLPENSSNHQLGAYALYNCTALTSVNLPTNFTSVGEGAFEGCENLAEILTKDVKEIGRAHV